MIATMLVQANGSQPWYLCGYLLVAGFISTIATMWLGTIRERNDMPHTEPASAATASAEAATDAAV